MLIKGRGINANEESDPQPRNWHMLQCFITEDKGKINTAPYNGGLLTEEDPILI